MRKLTTFLMMALMAVPFLQSCSHEFEQADQAALVTVKKSLNAAGFYGILDNGQKLYPGNMRVSYTPSNDLQRAIVYFAELSEPREGYAYNADVFNVAEVTTKNIIPVETAEADTLTNGIEITEIWVSGGFLNVEFKMNVEQYYTTHLTVDLQDMLIDGTPEIDNGYYPLELGFKSYPELENGLGTTYTTMACFYLGDYSLDNLGCEGYKIKYRSLNSSSEEPDAYKLVKPDNLQ